MASSFENKNENSVRTFTHFAYFIAFYDPSYKKSRYGIYSEECPSLNMVDVKNGINTTPIILDIESSTVSYQDASDKLIRKILTKIR
jgi:hypothetical protein